MPESIVGVWNLAGIEFRSAPGQVSHPFGKTPSGMLVITRDGHLSLQVMDSRRPRFDSGDVLGATLEEKASAMRGFSAYSGTYDVKGNRLIIHVATSLFPNWVGQDEERTFMLEGDRLEIRTRSVLAGGSEVSAVVIWRRVSRLV
jgi:hypothetical protein